MAINPQLHPDDERELLRIRRELCGWRQVSGLTQKALAEKIERSESFIYDLENGNGRYRLSSLQQWAGGFDLRVEPHVAPIGVDIVYASPVPLRVSEELEMMLTMSRPFEARPWVRLHIVQVLVSLRHARGLDAGQMAARLGLTRGAVTAWELNGHDPLVAKLFTYARAIDARVHLDLIERQDWVS